MDDEVKVQIRFTIDDPETGASFSDALYYSPEVFETLKPEDIELEKHARFDNWKAAVADAQNAPPIDPVIAIANIDDQIDSLKAQRDNQVQDVADTYSIPKEQIESAIDAIQAQPDNEEPLDTIKVVADDIAAQAIDAIKLTDETVKDTPVEEKTDVAQSDSQIGG